MPVHADIARAPPLKPITVIGRRPVLILPDDEVKKQVEAAMQSDPYFNDAHVSVTIKDGVVTLEGIVQDEWDLRAALRISKKVAGVRRVINDLELKFGGE